MLFNSDPNKKSKGEVQQPIGLKSAKDYNYFHVNNYEKVLLFKTLMLFQGVYFRMRDDCY